MAELLLVRGIGAEQSLCRHETVTVHSSLEHRKLGGGPGLRFLGLDEEPRDRVLQVAEQAVRGADVRLVRVLGGFQLLQSSA